MVKQLIKTKAVSRAILGIGTTFHLGLHCTYSAGIIPTRLILFLRTVAQGKALSGTGLGR